MKKLVWTYGLIIGVLNSSVMLLYALAKQKNIDFSTSELIGFGVMFISFALIYPAIKSFKTRFGNNKITFSKAFTIGFYISLIASTIYVAAWLIAYFNFIPDFADIYIQNSLQKMQAKGVSAKALEITRMEFEKFRELYKNPFANMAITYSEILPVGLIVSLLSSLVLKSSEGSFKYRNPNL